MWWWRWWCKVKRKGKEPAKEKLKSHPKVTVANWARLCSVLSAGRRKDSAIGLRGDVLCGMLKMKRVADKPRTRRIPTDDDGFERTRNMVREVLDHNGFEACRIPHHVTEPEMRTPMLSAVSEAKEGLSHWDCETSERICSLTVAILKQERFSRSKNDDDRVEQKHANAAEGKDKSENNRQGKGKNFVKKKGHLSNKEKVHPKERHTTSSKARAEKVDKLDI